MTANGLTYFLDAASDVVARANMNSPLFLVLLIHSGSIW